jgi:hypothetical protein
MAMPWPIIQMGVDEKGWNTIDFEAAPGGRSQKVQLKRWGRKLEIVLQDKPIRVHVNPKVGGFDQWERPIGSGKGMWVGSPLEPPADNDPYMEQVFKRPAGGEKESAETVPPAKRARSAASAGCEKESAETVPPAKRARSAASAGCEKE